MLNFDDLSAEELHRRGSQKWSGITGPRGCLDGAWIAEMDFGSAPAVEQALHRAIDEGFFGYMPAHLVQGLKEAAAQLNRDFYNWSITPEEIFLAPDVLSTLRQQILLETDPGDQILVPTPAYMPFLTIPRQLGREIVQVPSRWVTDHWELDWTALAQAAKPKQAKLLVLCNPWNPCGRALQAEELHQIGQLALQHGLQVFSDEIHAPLVLNNGTHLPFASLSADYAAISITAQAASKGWNVAGLKCAQLILPDPQVRQRWEAHQLLPDLEAEATPFGALAARVAYTEGRTWLAEVKAYLAQTMSEVRELVLAEVPSLRIPKVEATYLQAWDCSALGELKLCQIAEQAGVGINAGTIMGQDFPGLIRFNTATARHLALDMAQRLARELAKYQ